MNRTFTQPRTSRRGIQSGFTIVELLIVIVIIGILAAIIVVTYNGVQKKAVTAAMSSDLHNAAMTMESDKAVSEDDSYSLTLPSSIRASKGVSLSLEATGSTPVYTGLNSVQNALLLFTTCAELVSEGVGARPADNHDYISECRVYSKTQFNVNGWNGRDINTPISVTSLQSYVSSYAGGQKQEFSEKAGIFMTQLASRFQTAGGTFPVTGFWDSWATPTNGGVMKPTLPAPTSTGSSASSGETYCINATYDKNTSLRYYIRNGGSPTAGSCR